MERLLHYVWKHKLFPLRELKTTQGEKVEVIDPGLHNCDEGPDFLNAKVRIGQRMWVGSVEIHLKASDWHRHGHDGNAKYANVILHVVGEDDCTIADAVGKDLPQLVLEVPQRVTDNYDHLLKADKYPRCHTVIASLPKLTVHSWLSALQTERFEQKSERIISLLTDTGGDWERTFFITLARNFGFGLNGDAFEAWGRSIPLMQVGHHRDNLFQVEAFFIGQAGLLQESMLNDYYRDEAHKDGYFDRLKKEYDYLAHKFSLVPMDVNLWNFLRLRPQNFPHIRLSQLAQLYFDRRLNFSTLIETETVEEIEKLFATHVTQYWETHYTFGSTSTRTPKNIGKTMVELVLINTVAPLLFAYGRRMQQEKCVERAFAIMERLKAENNHITRIWAECGLEVKNASDSQALVQLRKEYCDRRECLRCRFGYEYLKQNNGI